MSGTSIKTNALAFAEATEQTIASGVATIDTFWNILASETGTTDTVTSFVVDLTTLTVGAVTYEGLFAIRAKTGHVITLDHGASIDLPDDTDVTVSDDGWVLIYIDSSAVAHLFEAVASGGAGTTIPDSVGVIYVAKYGNDSDDGLTIATPKLTIGAAITAAASDVTNGTGAVPSVTNRVLVKVLDSGHYEDETSDVLTCQSFINIDARNAKLLGRLELVDNVVCHFSWIEALSNASALAGTCVRKNSGTGLAYIFVELLQCKGVGLGVYNANAGQVFVRFGKLEVTGAGFGVGDDGSAPSGHVHVYGGDIYLEANDATGVAISGANSIVGTVEHILEIPAGTLTGTRAIALLTGATGEIDLNVQGIVADTTYEVIAGTLNLIVNSMTGSVGTITGTANILHSSLYALLAGRAGDKLIMADDATTPPWQITERSAAPSSPATHDVYLDDGTNTPSGTPSLMRYTGAAFEVIGSVDTANIADDAVGADQLADTAVTPGSYTATNLTVDQQGRITAAASGSAGATESRAYVEDQKAQNTNAGTFTSGAWRTRDLNTIVSDPDDIISIRKLAYTSGGTYEIIAGNVITGATSSVTATVFGVQLASGTWAGGDAVGTLWLLNDQSGAFQSENLNVGANSNVATIAADSAKDGNFALLAGDYEIDGSLPAYDCDNHQGQLQNMTDSTTLKVGSSEHANTAGNVKSRTHIRTGQFTIAALKVFQFQHQCQTTNADDGFGRPCNFTTEVYSQMVVRKVG